MDCTIVIEASAKEEIAKVILAGNFKIDEHVNLIEPMFMEEDQFMKIFLANVFRLYSIEKNNSDAGSNFRRAAYDANVSLNAL